MAIINNIDQYLPPEELGASLFRRDPSEKEMSNAIYTDLDGGMDSGLEEEVSILIQKRPSLRRNRYIIDWNTKNKSFLRVHKQLKALGIKQNKFFLRIYDASLIGVDPYHPNLPMEIQLKVILECIINPWYYLREVCRIPADATAVEVGGGVPYKLDRNNLAGWYCYLNGIDNYRSKPRQQGKTQDVLAQFLYAFLFGAKSSQFILFNKDQPQSKQNLYRFKCQRDLLPQYMQARFQIQEDGTLEKGTDNILMVRNPVNGNSIQCMNTAPTKEAGTKLGRGATAAFINYDEFDYMRWNIEVSKASTFAHLRAAAESGKRGYLYTRCYSSTPGDPDTRDGKAASKFKKRMLRWDDTFYEISIEELKRNLVDSNSYNGIMFIEHSWQQLGLSNSWYEEQCRAIDFDEEQILREVLLQELGGSNQSPFHRSDLIYLSTHKRIPIDQIDMSTNLSPIYLYEKLHRNYPYIIAVDPSEGLARDNNAMTIINPYTQLPVAEFKSPFITQTNLGKMIIKLMDNHCPKAMIVVENNKGRELINFLLESRYKYSLWFDVDKLGGAVVENIDHYGSNYKQVQAAYMRRAYGVNTGRTTRPQMYSILENFMDSRKDDLYTEYIVQDICGLIRKPNGKIEAGGSSKDDGDDLGHDDNLMSYLIGLFVYFNASNLEEFGIRRGAEDPEVAAKRKGRPIEEDPKAIREKMLEVMGGLSEEMQSLFADKLKETDPVQASRTYYEEIAKAQLMQRGGVMDENEFQDPIYMDPNVHIPSRDESIFGSNFERDYDVNLDDWL